jgi:mannose-6-phosphate isomerase-like protein (cupin superfamily)
MKKSKTPKCRGSEMKAHEMSDVKTKRLPAQRDAIAPDGSDVRLLLGLKGGALAHFELALGITSIPIAHRTVEEIWYFLSGRGEMWRKREEQEELTLVEPGVCLTIPVETHFQFRSFEPDPLTAIGVTMPPWPGEGEAYVVPGKWTPTAKTEY